MTMPLQDEASKIAHETRRSWLVDVLGWSPEQAEAFNQPPAGWIIEAIQCALSKEPPP